MAESWSEIVVSCPTSLLLLLCLWWSRATLCQCYHGRAWCQHHLPFWDRRHVLQLLCVAILGSYHLLWMRVPSHKMLLDIVVGLHAFIIFSELCAFLQRGPAGEETHTVKHSYLQSIWQGLQTQFNVLCFSFESPVSAWCENLCFTCIFFFFKCFIFIYL